MRGAEVRVLGPKVEGSRSMHCIVIVCASLLIILPEFSHDVDCIFLLWCSYAGFYPCAFPALVDQFRTAFGTGDAGW